MRYRQGFVFAADDGGVGGGGAAAPADAGLVGDLGATSPAIGATSSDGLTYTAPDGTKYTRVAEPTGGDDGKAKPPAATEPKADPKTAGGADPSKTADPIKDAGKLLDPGAGDAGEIKTGADYKLTLPEGVTRETDPVLAGFLDTAAEQKLSTAQAQAVIDKFGPTLQAQVESAQRNTWASVITEWQGKVKADPEIGGPKLTETVSRVNAAIRKFGAGADGSLSEVNEWMQVSGAHSHPAFIRMIYRMAALLGEGNNVAGGGSGAGRGNKSAAEIMYPSASKAA